MFVCANVFVCVCGLVRVCNVLFRRPTVSAYRLVFPILMYFVFVRQIDSLEHANWEWRAVGAR